MPDQGIKKPIVVDKFLGMYSSLPSNLIPDFYLANSLNMSYSSIGYANPFPLYSLFLTHTVNGFFKSATTFTKPNGVEIPLLYFDTGAKCTLYWYNAVNGKLEILLDNLTTGTRMAFSGRGFNTTTSDGIFFCNGTQNYSFWDGGIGSVASNTGTVITLNEDATTAGFAASGNVIVDGTEYAYTGRSGSTLTGLTSLPAFTAGAGVATAADDSTHSSITKFDILWVQDGRVWGARTDDILVKYSQVGVGTNFTSADNPNDPGAFDVIEGTGPITGGATFKDYSIIFKKDLVKYYQLVYPSLTSKTRNTDIIRQGDDAGGAGPDAVLSLDDRVYYVSKKGGIRWVGNSENKDGFTFSDFTNTIRPTLKEGVFTGSHLFYNEAERVLVATYKNDSDSSKEDRQITVEFVEDDALAQVRPVNINDWPIGPVFKYAGTWYGCSNITKQIYKLFDGYSKNGAPAMSLMTLKRYAFGSKFTRKSVSHIGIQGRLADGCLLHFTLSYNQNGALKFLEATLESDEMKFITQGDVHVIGTDEIGAEPIGGNLADIEELNPFMVFFNLPTNAYFYDLELTIYCEGVNSDGATVGNRYNIETVGFYIKEESLNIDRYRIKNFNEINTNTLGGLGSFISPLSELSPLGSAGTDYVRIGADADGSWRLIIDSANLNLEKKESGTWTTKNIFTP